MPALDANPLPVADPSAGVPLASAPAARPLVSRTPADRAATTPDALPGLARLLMRRAAMVGGLVLLLALVLGLARMGDDIDEEVDAGLALATAMATLGRLPQASDAQALAALASLAGAPPLRHLVLEVHAADGRPLLAAAPPAAEPWWERGLLALHRRWLSAPDARHVDWVVPRPDGQPWRVTLAASHEAERREAMGALVGSLLLLLGCVAGLLVVLRWNLRHALAPLGRLLAAIDGIEHQGPAAVQALPAMPVRELDAVAAALRHLGAALDAAEQRRRLISQQMLSLQDDERARLARELHDEFGQHLTALRVDAAWLARQVANQPALASVVAGMAQQCSQVQDEIRSLLTRLQPFGPAADGDDAQAGEPLARLATLLQALVDGWAPPAPGAGTQVSLVLGWHDGVADGPAGPWPAASVAPLLCLPRPLLLTLYRISQEALTNVARHAQARHAVLQLHCHGAARPGARLRIAWSVADDGVGVRAAAGVLPRGNGIAGIQQRVWAQGSDLQLGPATADASAPGWRMAADFDTQLLPAPVASAQPPRAP